jgi:hypothetical protein
MKLKEIAERITAHLKRFEADETINAPREQLRGTRPYYRPYAVASGRLVYITYISYQRQSHLTKDEAIAYLEALDAGFVGRQFNVAEWLRKAERKEQG